MPNPDPDPDPGHQVRRIDPKARPNRPFEINMSEGYLADKYMWRFDDKTVQSCQVRVVHVWLCVWCVRACMCARVGCVGVRLRVCMNANAPSFPFPLTQSNIISPIII